MKHKKNKVPKKQQGGWMDVLNMYNPSLLANSQNLTSSYASKYTAPQGSDPLQKAIYDQSQQILPMIGPMGALFQGQQGYMDYLKKPKDDLTEVSGFHGFQKGGLINNTDYTPGTPSMNNPYNIIPSSNITMQNTPFPILGIANTGEHKVMMPGNNYKFSNADYVAEVPMMGFGGFLKNAWNGVKNVGKEIGKVGNDWGLGIADSLGNASGLWDINNSSYKTKLGQKMSTPWDNISGVVGNVAKSATGVNFGGGQQSQQQGQVYPQYQQPQQQTLPSILQQLQMASQFLPMFGVGNFQAGGEVQNQEPLFSAVQTEKGEFIGSETGDILPVKAKKRHKNMDDDEVTDILPQGSFIFSRTKSSTIDKNKKVKGIDLNEINLGYTPVKYSETESTPSPDKIKFLDFMSKNKFTPADLANKLQKTYKVTDKDDPFSQLSNEQNKMSRIPYLEIIKGLNEIKKPKDNKYQDGGMVYNYSAKNTNGLPINEVQTIQDSGRDPFLERDRKIYSNKSDPYEYMYFNGEIVTRKKNNKGTAWNKINDAGAANLEKWIAEGKYKSYDEDRSVSKIPNSGTQLKNTPAKINGSSNTSNISKNTRSPYTSEAMGNYYSNPENVAGDTFNYWNNLHPNQSSYNLQVTDENIPGQQNEMGAITSNFMPVYSNIVGMGAGNLAMNGLRSLATRYGGNTAIPVMNRVFNSGRQYPQIGNNTLQLPSPGLTSPGMYSPGVPQPGLPLPGLPMGYQFGGNVFSPQFSQPSNKAIDGIMGYTNPYDLQDKSLRKNGLYGPDLLKAPTTLNKNFFNFKEGGEVPKYQAGALIAGLAGPVIDLGLGIYDRYKNNKNYKATINDINAHTGLANTNAQNTLGIGLGSSLMNYGLQDTGYTFADYDPQISRVGYTGDIIDSRLNSQMQNSLDANRALSESMYRNLGRSGLTPSQLANYMAKANTQAIQGSNTINSQYNNAIIGNLQNKSNLLNQYFDRKALDRQTGYNVMRNNRNVLNSGLTNSMNSLGSNYFNTLTNIDQNSLAAKMAARNQNANFNINNGLRIGDAALQVGNAVYNNYLQNKNAVQNNGLPSYNNFINDGNYNYNGQIYNKYDTGYQPPVILGPDGSVIRDV